ncbi:class I SAM-dependent methyltransferase [Floridanema aerugineum]|uniref:Class I SAM-dependent methyltransferase n=1 Tax=Floridaenema aerugineum BLCC-F46 TaxID=3153654 RepID=A0ABV4XGL2_9CYAN
MSKQITREKIIRKIRQIRIASRWLLNEIIDDLNPSMNLNCPICNFSGETEKFKPYVTRCIFGGGKLLRHECPDCGVIFGTQRMLALSPQALEQEYVEHYSCFNEGDSTESEIRTFDYLNPKKEGIYLNFGCGKWSKSIEYARSKGYQLFGFEPYAKDEKSNYIINDVELLKSMKFDGIISNDVLEHLRYPDQTLSFMSSLLKDDGIMIHTTHCYNYACEYTRFHLFFFTGNSLKIISQKAGLAVEDTDRIDTKIFRKLI